MREPERGFYYHYKHDPAQGIEHHAYEVTGLARHSEDESLLVRYRPLYASAHLGEADEYARPLSLWDVLVEWEGKTLPRFTRIEDQELIAKLRLVREEMYG